MTKIIKIKDLSKYYGGNIAINNLNLEIESGKIVGILGPNGSGKTTLLKLLAGLLKKTRGEILIDNEEPGVYTKSIVAFLPDRNFIYPWMKIKDALDFFYDFFPDFNLEKSKEMLEFMELDLKV